VLHGMTALYCVRLSINPGPVPLATESQETHLLSRGRAALFLFPFSSILQPFLRLGWYLYRGIRQAYPSLPGSDRLANKVRSLCLRFFPVEKAQSSIEGSRLWMGWLFWTGSSIVRLMGVTKPVSRNLFHP
jgi:hypothetical protein